MIYDVTICLVRLNSREHIYVKMPNQQESVNVMGGFLEITGFPDVYVIGAITYVCIYIRRLFHKTAYDQAKVQSGRNFGPKSRKETKLCFIKRRTNQEQS